jgi:hypothetical protein
MYIPLHYLCVSIPLAVTNPVPDMLTTLCESIRIGCSIACNLETTCRCRTRWLCTVPAVGAAGVAGY